MTATVAQFVHILDRLAPPRLAESWDNVGLQIGNLDWAVNKVWTALDPLPEVVAAACENDVDLLVTHHPLFFKPIQSIDCASPQGKIAEMALSRKLAIVCAHTNLDSTEDGVNDVLADRMGLQQLRALTAASDDNRCKLVLFAPATHVKTILDVLFDRDSGRIGNYSCCTFRCEGVGTFLPGPGTSPSVGMKDVLSEVQESRIEILATREDVGGLVEAIKTVHPYETMAYDVYPLVQTETRFGLGRVGTLPRKLHIDDFARRLKSKLNLPVVKVVGNKDRMIETVAICSGSGSSLLKAAVGSGAQVYVSGDLGYHTARDAQQAGIGLIDIGHFGSEQPIVDVLAGVIRREIDAAGISAVVEANSLEKDPFQYL